MTPTTTTLLVKAVAGTVCMLAVMTLALAGKVDGATALGAITALGATFLGGAAVLGSAQALATGLASKNLQGVMAEAKGAGPGTQGPGQGAVGDTRNTKTDPPSAPPQG